MEESIGKTLRQARVAADISLDDVVYIGKIPRAVAEALEADDFGFFSSPFYARSFLEKYSRHLGVDAGNWLNALEPTVLIDHESIDSLVEVSRNYPNPLIERGKTRSSGGMASLSILLISAVLVYAGIKFYQNFERLHSETSQEPSPAPSLTETPPEEEPEQEEASTPVITDTAPPRAIIVEGGG